MNGYRKAFAEFRAIVDARGGALRSLNRDQLLELGQGEPEKFTIGKRGATITIIVERATEDRLRVVIQGFMDHRFLLGQSVALDGFYKHADGSVSPMAEHEFYPFG
jgi:hypothetical protein